MPPIVLTPPHNGTTQGTSSYFNPTNAHGLHPPTSLAQWKVTVTTAQSNGGTLITETSWSPQPIGTCQVNSLPANNGYYWTQIVYKTSSGSQYVSSSNKFQSQP